MPATVWKGHSSFLDLFLFRYACLRQRVRTLFISTCSIRSDQSRVKEVWYCVQEDKPLDRTDIEKGYGIGKGKYVVVEDEELKKIAPPTATTMDILRFVDSGEVDPIYFEASYYLAADNRTAKPYVLFLAALKATKQDAVARSRCTTGSTSC